jgi:uncharacterized protein with GYD domain
MIFVTLIKFKKKASDVVEVGKKIMKELPEGVKIIGTYWTLGRFDSVWIYEGRTEKDAVKMWANARDAVKTETMVALSREDALKML